MANFDCTKIVVVFAVVANINVGLSRIQGLQFVALNRTHNPQTPCVHTGEETTDTDI